MSRKTFLLFSAGFLFALPFFTLASTLCWDECAYSGQRQDSGNQYRICGNYDSDYCLEWSDWKTKTIKPLCWDECVYTGQKKCVDSSKYQICGNYDSDYCLEWSSSQSCPSGRACQDGKCISPPRVITKGAVVTY